MKEEAGTLPNSFYEASIILVPKPDKDSMKKKDYSNEFVPNSLFQLDQFLSLTWI